MIMLDHWKMLGEQPVSDEELGASLLEAAKPFGLEGQLQDRLEDVLLNVLGEPNDPDNLDGWRYGKKGSLSVGLAGGKRGLWNSFEDGDAGGADVLGLLAWEPADPARWCPKGDVAEDGN